MSLFDAVAELRIAEQKARQHLLDALVRSRKDSNKLFEALMDSEFKRKKLREVHAASIMSANTAKSSLKFSLDVAMNVASKAVSESTIMGSVQSLLQQDALQARAENEALRFEMERWVVRALHRNFIVSKLKRNLCRATMELEETRQRLIAEMELRDVVSNLTWQLKSAKKEIAWLNEEREELLRERAVTMSIQKPLIESLRMTIAELEQRLAPLAPKIGGTTKGRRRGKKKGRGRSKSPRRR